MNKRGDVIYYWLVFEQCMSYKTMKIRDAGSLTNKQEEEEGDP